jgi:hypothetical protein
LSVIFKIVIHSVIDTSPDLVQAKVGKKKYLRKEKPDGGKRGGKK